MSQDLDLEQAQPMVGWFSPRLLLRAAFHTTVAGLFGQFADQRTIQHLEDPFAQGVGALPEIVGRHDYSDEARDGEAFWVDFVADLGDGFDSTYSVAYLLAADALRGSDSPATPKIAGVRHLARNEVLPHGKILIMGGDQVYPWPSPEEYRRRLQLPYSLALPHAQPFPHAALDTAPAATASARFAHNERHVFAIPGNHDWYDGLAAFDDLFCGARGRRNHGTASCLGAWTTQQHRSYFAIKLPYNWWIWAADIQLSEQLDAGQLNYFRRVAEQMQAGDKFILFTAQPSWLQFGTPREPQARANLRNLIDMPIRRQAKLCAIISGDTHHYSRYNENDVLGDFNLVIAGGGGAYIHGTHHLRDEIKFDWVGRTVDFRLDRRLAPRSTESDMTTRPEPTDKRATYPTRAQSIALAAGNWRFPFRNVTFAAAMGLIYWLLTWAISEMQVQHPHTDRKAAALPTLQSRIEGYKLEERSAPTPLSQRVEQRQTRQVIEKEATTRSVAQPQPTPQPQPQAQPPQQPPLPARLESQPVRLWMLAEMESFVDAMSASNLTPWKLGWWKEMALLARGSIYMLLAGLASSPATSVFVAAVFAVFILISETRLAGWPGRVSRFLSGTVHFVLHALAMWFLFSVLIYANHLIRDDWEQRCAGKRPIGWLPRALCPNAETSNFLLLPTDIWERLIYPFEMLLLGGLLAGLIFGVYIAVGYIVGRVNSDWAFSARGSPSYRNFLRMKLEPGRLTIHPIGLDSPPSLRKSWAMPGWLTVKDPAPGKPRVEPRFKLKPRLIEGPIVIDVNKVKNIPRPKAPD